MVGPIQGIGIAVGYCLQSDTFSGLRIHQGIVPCIGHLSGPKEGRAKALRVSPSSDFCGGSAGLHWTSLPLAVAPPSVRPIPK